MGTMGYRSYVTQREIAMSSKLSAIIFDWDGTLMDSVGHIVSLLVVAVAAEHGLQIEAHQARQVVGLGAEQAITQLFPDCPLLQRQNLIERFRQRYYLEPDALPTLFAGTEQVLQSLKADGYRLAVATGKSRRGLDLALKQTKTADYFEATRCADETHDKPHPLMIEQILDELALEPNQALLLGDTTYDMALAENAGIAAGAVSYGVHRREALLVYLPAFMIDTIEALPQAVAGLA